MGIGTQDLKFRVLAQVVGANAFQSLASDVSNISKQAQALKTGLGALGAFFAVDKIKDFGQGLLDSGDQLYKMSQKTGVSVETLAELQNAAAVSGVSFEELGTSLRKLSVNVVQAGNGNKELSGTFKGLGIDIKNQDGSLKSSGDILLELADKFAGLQDGPGKAAIAVKLFGRAGSDIIPLLNQGADSIRGFSSSIDTDFAARAEQFNKSMIILGQNVKNGAIDSLKELLPTMQEIADSFKILSSGASGPDSGIGFFDLLGEAARQTSYLVIGLTTAIKLVYLEASYGYKEILSLFKSSGPSAIQLDNELAAKLKALKDNEDAALKKLNGNSIITGQGSAEEIKKRQRTATDPEAKGPKAAPDTDSIGENAKIIQSFNEKLAKLQAESDSYGQNNAQKEAAVLLAELESKGIEKTSAAYQTLAVKIKAVTDSRETSKETQAAKEYQTTQERQIALDALTLQQVDMSTLEYQKLTEAKKIDNQTTEATKNFTADGAQAYKDAAEAVKTQRLALLDLEQQQKETWSTGAKQALKDYVESAKDTAAQVKSAFSDGFRDMEDSLVTFIKGGTLNFAKFADDIITDIIRIQVRAAIAQAATGAAGLFSGLFSSGGGATATAGESSVDASTLSANGNIMTSRGPAKLNRYANGGVANSPQVSIFGEGRTPEAYVPLPDGRSIPVSLKGAGQGSKGGDTNVTISIASDGSQDTKSSSTDAEALGKMISAAVQQQILKAKRPGGLLA